MYKVYAYIKFENVSPLAIGTCQSTVTDKDLLRDSKGNPYIPGTALTGVYRTFFRKNDEDNEQKKYFGYVGRVTEADSKSADEDNGSADETEKKESQSGAAESKLVVYDGVFYGNSGKAQVGIRNGVGLDQFRTAVEGAKFDYEVLEPGFVFWTALEYTTTEGTKDKPNMEPVDRILAAWETGRIAVGGKTTRGLGRLKTLEMKTVVFQLPEQMDDWLRFDLYADAVNQGRKKEKWKEWKIECRKQTEQKEKNCQQMEEGNAVITLRLKQEGPVTVRVYSTEVAKKKEEGKTLMQPLADYAQLMFQEKGGAEQKEVAVIPGTSWAGAFRHNMAAQLGMDWNTAKGVLEELFGRIQSSGNGQPSMRSKIWFSETYFRNGQSKLVSRNAIDRFSGGAANRARALFTEKMYYGGTDGILTIVIPRNLQSDLLRALAISIADLHEGFLSVGGNVSVGHGLFSVTGLEMDGVPLSGEMTGEHIYHFIMQTIKKEGERGNG